jgi:hypothetical protein
MRDFPTLFTGRDDVHGIYTVPTGTRPSQKGKLAGTASTRREPVTAKTYAEHLAGKRRLGIIPIRLDQTVMWIALDVDEYKTPDLPVRLAKKIAKLGLPLVMTRTKSGGIHLWCFFRDPMKAKVARELGAEYVKKLGLNPRTEVFPKQDTIREEDEGSWINLPYFGKTCPALDDSGKVELSLEEFLERADEHTVSRSDLKKGAQGEDLDFEEAPPCISVMLADGVEEGGRDNALMHIGVFLARAHPDDWEQRLAEINDEKFHPPLNLYDVGKVVKSLQKKNYQYLCKQQPMCAACDKETCLTRKFGVGGGEAAGAAILFDSIEKLDGEDPIYRIEMGGRKFQVNAETLFRYSAFQIAAMKSIDRVLPTMKQNQWLSYLQDQLATMQISKPPEDTQMRARVIEAFKEWAQQTATETGAERILESGLPYYNGESVFFRGNDFLSIIDRNIRVTRQEVWIYLRDWGVVEDTLTIKSEKVRLWRCPIGKDKWLDVGGAHRI